MKLTKRRLLEQAFDDLGIAAGAYDLPPDQLNAALFKMEAMIATWNSRGVAFGWPMGDDLDASIELPDATIEAITSNLALRLAPSYGKSLSVDSLARAKSSRDIVLARYTEIPCYQSACRVNR